MPDPMPPGYNTNPINQQSVSLLGVPGAQGATAQGYLGQLQNEARSSFALPSSYNVPSSINTPNNWYSQQGQSNPMQSDQVMSMIKALMGTGEGTA